MKNEELARGESMGDGSHSPTAMEEPVDSLRPTNRGARALGRFFQSNKDAAAKLGIDPSHFSLLLAGKRLPSIQVAAAIEREWGVPCRFWAEDQASCQHECTDISYRCVKCGFDFGPKPQSPEAREAHSLNADPLSPDGEIKKKD